MKDINNPNSNLSKALDKMAVNSNLTKILFKYSGYVSTPTLGATWKGKDFVIAMRFRLVQLIAVVFLFLDSTFFLVEMEKYENPSKNHNFSG